MTCKDGFKISFSFSRSCSFFPINFFKSYFKTILQKKPVLFTEETCALEEKKGLYYSKKYYLGFCKSK